MEEKIVKPTTSSYFSTPVVVKPVQPETSSKVEQVEKLTDVENKPKEVIDSLIPSDDYRTSPLWYEVISYLGVPQPEWDGAKNEISTIVDYVIRDIQSNDPDQVVLALRKLEDRIERPSWDEKRYKVLYRYVRLASKKASISAAMKAFEKKGVDDER